MRERAIIMVAMMGALALSGCGGKRQGVMGHAAPDEFAVSRRAPLVIPPDFALNPPKPGAPRPQEADSSTQALQAMFGGNAPRSESEQALLGQTGTTPDASIRSTAGDPNTTVVNKGQKTKDIVAAPESSNPNASASVPQ